MRLAKETRRSISAVTWCWSERPDFRSPSRSWCAPWRWAAFVSTTNWCQQVRRILDAGLSPTHLDTHKHTHLLPPVLEAVARISEEFRIPWVRRPFDFPLQPGGVGWKNQADAADERALPLRARASSLPLDGLVRGIPDSPAATAAADLADVIRALPEGVTEFMCHPGRCGDDLRSARTRLKESREEELRALTAPEVRVALAEAGVETRQLSATSRLDSLPALS